MKSLLIKLALLLALLAPLPTATGCATTGAAAAAYLPKALLAINAISSALHTIDSFVGSLLTNPNVPAEFRQQYELAKVKAWAAEHAAQVALQKGEVAKDEAEAALAEARRTLDMLKEVLLRGGLLDPSGNLRAPPAYNSSLPAVRLE